MTRAWPQYPRGIERCPPLALLAWRIRCMLDHMGRSKRQPKLRQPQRERRHPEPAEPPGAPPPVFQLSPPEVLERIKRTKAALEAAESELAMLVDHAVGLRIGWPEIATQLGVTRQAARQSYQRRHRYDGSRQDRIT